MNILSKFEKNVEEPKLPTFAESIKEKKEHLLKNGAKSLFQIDCQRSFNGKLTVTINGRLFILMGISWKKMVYLENFSFHHVRKQIPQLVKGSKKR
jgi:hypothetical protein